MTSWNTETHGSSPASAPSPGPPKPGPRQDVGTAAEELSGAHSSALVADTELFRGEIEGILAAIEAGDVGQPGGAADLFESAHEVLLRALGTVDRA